MYQSIWFLPELGQPDSSESNACQDSLQFQYILFFLLIHNEILLRASDVLLICFSPNRTLKTMRSETKYSRSRGLATCAISPFTSRAASVEVCKVQQYHFHLILDQHMICQRKRKISDKKIKPRAKVWITNTGP